MNTNKYNSGYTGVFNITLLAESEQKRLKSEIEDYFINNIFGERGESLKIKLALVLSIEHPAKLAPFGAELELARDLNYSRRLLGEKKKGLNVCYL